MRSRGYTDCTIHGVSKTENESRDIPARNIHDDFTAYRICVWICGSRTLSSCYFERICLSFTFCFRPFTVSSIK